MKRAFVSGITGQDGSYLAELLLSKGYEVHGLLRRHSSINTWRIDHIFDRLKLHHGDLLDGPSLTRLLDEIQPQEIYHLAAQSHVRVSFDVPEYTADTIALGTIRLLEAVCLVCRQARFYQASSSEMFGLSPPPQNEKTPFRPRSPYACAKVHAYWSVVNSRDAYGLYASNGILFNHESPRRGETFVTRKIAIAAARIKAGLQKKLYLGNLSATRDFGYAPEYAWVMWRMLQLPEPTDLVIATGESHEVRQVLDVAFSYLSLDWREYVETDARLLRPTEVGHLCGDTSKAKKLIGWSPKMTFKDLIQLMVDAEVKRLG